MPLTGVPPWAGAGGAAAAADEDERQDELQVHTAWRRLRYDIVNGTLPPGESLRISRLKAQYGIGASPLREALSRLVAEGFVVSLDRRGFRVSPISLADFRDLTQARQLLECDALRLSFEHGDEHWESEVVAAFYRLEKAQRRLDLDPGEKSTDEWEQRNREFHQALVDACPSQWILRFRQAAYDAAERYRRLCLSVRSVPRDTHGEHRQLFEAALARDTEAAQALITEHLERTHRKVAVSRRLS